MKQSNELTTNQIHATPLLKCMLIGAGIGLALISLFLFIAGEGNPEWNSFWRIRPLVVVPIAGATGGLFYYVMDILRHRGTGLKILANIISLIVFVIGIWLGTVLGLAGTMWN